MKKLLNKISNSFKAWAARRRYARCVAAAARIVARTKAAWPGCAGAMATATWPPVSGTTVGFTVKGKTTIQWGSDGLLSSPFPGGGGFYTVTDAKQKLIIDRTKLPNGTGVSTSDVFVQDGASWEITVRDDSGMTPPVLNTAVTLVDGAGLLGTVGLTYSARVVDPSWETGVKKAAERTLLCENLVAIDSQTSAAQTAR